MSCQLHPGKVALAQGLIAQDISSNALQLLDTIVLVIFGHTSIAWGLWEVLEIVWKIVKQVSGTWGTTLYNIFYLSVSVLGAKMCPPKYFNKLHYRYGGLYLTLISVMHVSCTLSIHMQDQHIKTVVPTTTSPLHGNGLSTQKFL